MFRTPPTPARMSTTGPAHGRRQPDARRVVSAGIVLLAGMVACDNASSGPAAESGSEAEEVVLQGLEYALQAFPELERNRALIERVARPDAGSVPLDRTVAYSDSAHGARVTDWAEASGFAICRVYDHAICPELTADDRNIVALGEPRFNEGRAVLHLIVIELSRRLNHYHAVGYDLTLERTGGGWQVTDRRSTFSEHCDQHAG